MNKKKAENGKKKRAETEELKEKLAVKDEQLNDYINHLKRLQAEFENFTKRTEQERKELIGRASEKIIVKLLNIIDDFDRALTQLKIPDKKTKEGIQMIFKSMHKILDEENVLEIKSQGEQFDPFKHEVLLSVESEQAENLVLEELQKGYTMNGKVIRYSKVKIAKPKLKSHKGKEDK